MYHITKIALICTAVLALTNAQLDDQCFKTEQLSITVDGANTDIQGWKNVRQCSCQQARDEGLALSDSGIVGNFVPHCTDSGDFHEHQVWGSVGTSWCVDSKGDQNSLTNFRGNVALPCNPPAGGEASVDAAN